MEKIDVVEWFEEPKALIKEVLSPAQVLSVEIIKEAQPAENQHGHAIVTVAADQQSLAIGRGGQNVRLAAKLTGWKIDIVSAQTEKSDEDSAEERSTEESA